MTQQQGKYGVQVAQDEIIPSDITPPEIRERNRKRSLRGAMDKLDTISDLRDLLDEWEHYPSAHEQIYKEFAEDCRKSKETIRRWKWQTDGYEKEDMYRWIIGGLAFEHIEKARNLALEAKITPVQLLNECITFGGANGKPMTVDEMATHALGGKPIRPSTFKAFEILSKLSDLPRRLKWNEEKTKRFEEWIQAGKDFLKNGL